MDKLMNNKPLSIWRFLVVIATIFTLTPVIALIFFSMDVPVALASQIIRVYGDNILMGGASFLIPVFGLVFIFSQSNKNVKGEDESWPELIPSRSAQVTISFVNKIALICAVFAAILSALDSSVLNGVLLFIATVIASGSGASIKYALVDANHPSQPLVIILGVLVVFLSSWLAPDTVLTYDNITMWSGYWAPMVGIVIGLTAINKPQVTTQPI